MRKGGCKGRSREDDEGMSAIKVEKLEAKESTGKMCGREIMGRSREISILKCIRKPLAL